MGKRLYGFLKIVVGPFLPRLEVSWETPFDGEPCVFVCNHDRAMGPLQIAARFPLMQDSRIWIFADPLSRETTPAYVRQDHWWKEDSRLAPFYNAVIPPVVSWILPPILRSVPYIAVYHDGRAVRTMKDSLRALRDEKKHVIIFPEIPTAYGEHDTGKINEGFLNLLPMYRKLTGKNLAIWPVHLDRERKQMAIKAPISMDPERPLAEQTAELSRKILRGIFDPAGEKPEEK